VVILNWRPRLAPDKELTFHDPPYGAVHDLDVLAVQLLPDFLRTIETITVGLGHPQDLALERLVALLSLTHRPCFGGVVRRRGEVQYSADWPGPPPILSRIDVANYFLV